MQSSILRSNIRLLKLKMAISNQETVCDFKAVTELTICNFCFDDIYTPGIYAEGYIVFVFQFVCSFVCSFVRTSFRRVEFASKFCVKVSQVVYISATTYQTAFIFGP